MASRKPSPKPDLRLQKYLADCGVGSRRHCERLISDGRVEVDGESVVVQGVKIDPSAACVTVDGRPVTPEARVHFLLFKPAGILCTSSDPEGRATFKDLFPDVSERVYTVGRLDRDSEGLIIVTNDGSFAERVSHPRYELDKEYIVWCSRRLSAEEVGEMRSGVRSRGELLRVEKIDESGRPKQGAQYNIVLREGKNRHLRRMFECFDIRVTRLRRVRIGNIRLGRLQPGEHRHLNRSEISSLLR